LEFKGFDTLHCGIPKLLADKKSAWLEIFSDGCAIRYFIICKDENVLFTQAIDSRELLHNRVETQKDRLTLEKFRGRFKRYRKRHPYEFVEVIPTTSFMEKYLLSI